MFPILNPLLAPSPFHHSGSFQCTRPKHPVICIEPNWRSISHTVIYMFQCYSLKSSHPRLLPQSPKVTFFTSVSLLLSLIQGHLSVQISSVTQSCPTFCSPMNRSTPGLPVHHQLPEFTQTHVQLMFKYQFFCAQLSL